jgi:hypothetical protein
MKCPNCRHENHEGAIFCEWCEQPLVRNAALASKRSVSRPSSATAADGLKAWPDNRFTYLIII